MNEQMEFPETWEEYEQEYGFNDSDEVYTNNSRLIQSFRVKQWLDHLEQEPCDDMVSRGVFDQVRWERDIAISQLKVLGYELGQKVEPCENTISRQAVLDLAKKGVLVSNGNYESVCKAINEIPPVNPTKTGHWIFDDECKEHGHCSRCGYGSVDLADGEPHNYCPKCGAWMVEQETKINEDISKGFEEFTRMMFKQGQAESEE